jgi:hypothetical protein
MHMHYGAEEMFFVLSGRPLFRNQHGEEALAPGDFVFCPEGRAGLHTFSNPTDEPVGILAISAGSFPDVVAYPEHGYPWVATRDPDPDYSRREAIPASSPGSRSRSSRPLGSQADAITRGPRRLRRGRGRRGIARFCGGTTARLGQCSRISPDPRAQFLYDTCPGLPTSR